MIEPTFSAILAGYLFLVLFGLVFNLAISEMERRGWLEGYVALAVALGVLVTLGVVSVFSWQFALIALGAFTCSGGPMIAGSIYRHVRNRERYHQNLRGRDE